MKTHSNDLLIISKNIKAALNSLAAIVHLKGARI